MPRALFRGLRRGRLRCAEALARLAEGDGGGLLALGLGEIPRRHQPFGPKKVQRLGPHSLQRIGLNGEADPQNGGHAEGGRPMPDERFDLHDAWSAWNAYRG